MELSGLVAIAAAIAGVVLGAAGAAKLAEPAATVRALGALDAPASPLLARAVGIGELAVAVLLLGTISRWAAAVGALTYLVLLAVVVVLRRRSPDTPCGCFGQWSGPPSARHLVVTLAGGVACALAAVTDTQAGPPPNSTGTAVLGWWLAIVAAAAGVIVLLSARPHDTRRPHHTPRPGTRHPDAPAKEVQP